LYLASAISEQGDLEYIVRNKPFDSTAIIDFLIHLMAIFTQKLLIIWDGAAIHDSQEVRNFLTTLPKDKLYLVKQPFYSPELNGDEQVWNYLKNYQLKNTCIQNIKELHYKIDTSMDEMKKQPDLIPNFFKHPKLGFYNFL
jgi:DDE superfamily endonuclease